MKVFNRAVKLSGHERVINSVTMQVLQYDFEGNALLVTGVTVPTADSTGFAKGCLFIKTNAADGTKGLYENVGTKTASDFNLIGDIASAEIADNAITNAKLADNAVDTAELAADAVTAAKIEDDAVSIEHLDDGILPSHVVKFAGKHTTAGGDAAEQASVAGVVATDIVMATLQTDGTNNVTLLTAIPGTNIIDFVLSGDPSTDAIISYVVFRAAA